MHQQVKPSRQNSGSIKIENSVIPRTEPYITPDDSGAYDEGAVILAI